MLNKDKKITLDCQNLKMDKMNEYSTLHGFKILDIIKLYAFG